MSFKIPFGSLKVEKLNPMVVKGRPRKLPTSFASEEARQIYKLKEAHLKKDPVLKTLLKDSNHYDVVDAVMRELASESSLLKFERDQLANAGKDTSGVSQKRLTALRITLDAFFRKKDMVEGKSLDLKSPEVQRLMEFILMKVRDGAEDAGISEEMMSVLFDRIVDRLENAEPEMKAYIIDPRKH
jgi:hypothetical protein